MRKAFLIFVTKGDRFFKAVFLLNSVVFLVGHVILVVYLRVFFCSSADVKFNTLHKTDDFCNVLIKSLLIFFNRDKIISKCVNDSHEKI